MNWPEPPGQDSRPKSPTCFVRWRPDANARIRSVRIARIPASPSDRTSRLLVETPLWHTEPAASPADYFDEPPSNRTNTSRRIRLYGQPHDGWLDRPLSPAGEAGFTGCDLRQSCVSCALSSGLSRLITRNARLTSVDNRSAASDTAPCGPCYRRPEFTSSDSATNPYRSPGVDGFPFPLAVG